MGYGWNAPSEEDMGKNADFPILAEDEYILKVSEVSIAKDQPNNFPSKGDSDPTHDMIVVKAEVLSFADGEKLVDKDGEPVEQTLNVQKWVNPKKRGMIPQPSMTRKVFAAILGQPVGDPIDVEDFGELVGRTFIATLKPNEKGYNNIIDVRPHKRNRTRAAAATTNKGPVDADELMNKAKEIFNEDAPDNKTAVDDLDF